MKPDNFSITGHDGFRDFYLHTYPAVLGFVRKYLCGTDAVEDIVQESFFKLYKERHRFPTAQNARAWVYVAARNLCIDYLRHHRFNAGQPKDSFISDAFFLDEITRREAELALRGSIESLPVQTQRVAMLTYEGKSNAQIAEEMDISVNSVKTLKKEAYKKLRNILGDQYLKLLFIFLFP